MEKKLSLDSQGVSQGVHLLPANIWKDSYWKKKIIIKANKTNK